ncbi:unnamed protein product [Clonostachys rosea]|uniref:Uncharacterized protein n=1 Tax=Bionectria ochroleuca TaxID=29856 RepID=A0ABY6UQI5_BIOOC|nr:unnamed protein product [Clonostachys rosea]
MCGEIQYDLRETLTSLTEYAGIGSYSNPLLAPDMEVRQAPTFCVGDKVWLNMTGDREGPYLIASAYASASGGIYTLCGLDGIMSVRGKLFDAKCLEKAV